MPTRSALAPSVLRFADSNNTIVWPSSAYRRQGRYVAFPRRRSSHSRGTRSPPISGLGAPVVALHEAWAGPHRWRDLTLTLWQYAEPIGAAAPEPAEAAAVMSAVHHALAVFPGWLPRFDLELADARRLLRPERSPTLLDSDRHFLLSVIGHVEETLGGRVTESRALREPARRQLASHEAGAAALGLRDGLPRAA